MKVFKLNKVLVTILFIILSECVCANAESGTCGENLTWVLNNNILTIRGTGEMTDWTSYDSTSSKAAPWKSKRGSIKEVIIEEGVTSIGKYAFAKCTALKRITVPSTLEKCVANAFYGATQEKSVYISNLSEWCRIEFEGAASNPLNNGILYINGENVTDLIIPEDVTELLDYAFYCCKKIENIVIPASIKRIGQTFYNCVDLSSVLMADTVESIDSFAFMRVNGKWVSEINYAGTEEQWNEIDIAVTPIIYKLNFKRNTKTIISDDGIYTYCVGLEQGNCVGVGYYSQNRLIDSKFLEYKDMPVFVFPKNSSVDEIKIFTLQDMKGISPVGIAESSEL